jgi:DedD protein
MAETGTAPQPQDDDAALRRRLLARVAVAGAVMAGLLGGLMIFDSFFVKTERAPPTQTASAPTPIPDAKVAEAPAEEKPPVQAEGQTEAEGTAQASIPAEVAAEPERSAAPTGMAPPAKVERPLTVPARPQAALMRPTEPPMVAQKPEPAKELARVLPPAAAKETTPPIAQAMAAARRFLVQMGVFNSVANAEELRAKLELAGIPTQIEARVQVGPFATRKEAEQARDKLKDLGIEPGLVMAVRK